jgi:hypothetical protein
MAKLELSDAVGHLGWLFLGGPLHALGAECRDIEGCAGSCAL